MRCEALSKKYESCERNETSFRCSLLAGGELIVAITVCATFPHQLKLSRARDLLVHRRRRRHSKNS